MVEKTQTGGWFPNFYEPFRNISSRVADWFAPASEAGSTDDAYRIKVELPGVAADDVDISVHDGVLTLKGEKTSSREEEGETWYFSEREYGSFTRSFRLPADADAEAVDADLKDGVLTVTVAKFHELPAAQKKIPIRSS